MRYFDFVYCHCFIYFLASGSAENFRHTWQCFAWSQVLFTFLSFNMTASFYRLSSSFKWQYRHSSTGIGSEFTARRHHQGALILKFTLLNAFAADTLAVISREFRWVVSFHNRRYMARISRGLLGEEADFDAIFWHACLTRRGDKEPPSPPPRRIITDYARYQRFSLLLMARRIDGHADAWEFRTPLTLAKEVFSSDFGEFLWH